MAVYSDGVADEWGLAIRPDVLAWLKELRRTDRESAQLVGAAIQYVLENGGPAVGRPLVDHIERTRRISNLKELRPPTKGDSEIRILFVFDESRMMTLLVAGDKKPSYSRVSWYREAIKKAEAEYAEHYRARSSRPTQVSRVPENTRAVRRSGPKR